MKTYKNLSRDSGVTHYEIGENYIEVKFKDKADIYIYSYAKPGKAHVEKMKVLATQGRGLSTYITQHPIVKENFNRR